MKEVIEVMISEKAIQKRIEELSDEIMKEFNGKTVTLICVLKGGVMFMVDLARRLNMQVEYDFMDISSYGDSFESTGIVRINKDLGNPITGKNVLLVEDIIDTGRTLARLIAHLKSQNPEKLKVCTLLDKPERRVVDGVLPDYIGFTIPDKFVIGYGLDYMQRYRNLPYIGVMRFEEE